MDTLKFRRATLEDRDDVLAINDSIYGGMDYLSAFYNEFMDCPFTTSYVALLDQRIVGFVSTLFVDGSRTVITRAARVTPEAAGKGIFKKLNDFALGNCGNRMHAMTCSNFNTATTKDSFQRVHRKVLSKVMIGLKPCSSTELNLASTCIPPTSVCDDVIESFFKHSLIQTYLFPKDRIIINWVPFRLLKENIGLMRMKGNRTHMLSDVSVALDGKATGLLSISTTYTCLQLPQATMLDIYGTDDSALRKHIVAHLEHIKRVTKSDYLSMLVFVEPDFDFEQVEKTLTNIGLNNDGMKSELLLYEKDLGTTVSAVKEKLPLKNSSGEEDNAN